MIMGSLSTLALIGVILCLHVKVSSSVHLSITPDHYSSRTPENVDISCMSKGINDEAKEIILLQISKDGGKPIAQIHQGANVTKGTDDSGTQKFEVAGHIDPDDVSKSYLNLTLILPDARWAGEFSCTVYFLNIDARLETEVVRANLTVTEKLAGVEDLESLRKQLEDLKEIVQRQGVENKRMFVDLNNANKRLMDTQAVMVSQYNAITTMGYVQQNKMKEVLERMKTSMKNNMSEEIAELNATVVEVKAGLKDDLSALEKDLKDNLKAWTGTFDTAVKNLAEKADVSSLRKKITLISYDLEELEKSIGHHPLNGN